MELHSFLRSKSYETDLNVSFTIKVKVLGRISFHVMAENGKHVKDTLAFSVFFVCSNRNKVLLTSDLLPIISPVVCQLSVNILLGLHARDISTS